MTDSFRYQHARANTIRSFNGKWVFDRHRRYTIKQVQHSGFCSALEFNDGEPYFKCDKRSAIGCFCDEHSRERSEFQSRRAAEKQNANGENGKMDGDGEDEGTRHAPSPPLARASDFADAPWAKTRSDSIVDYALRDRHDDTAVAAAVAHKADAQPFVSRCHQALWSFVEKRAVIPPLRTSDFALSASEGYLQCERCHERSANAMYMPCTHKLCLFCVHERAERGDLTCCKCAAKPMRVMRI